MAICSGCVETILEHIQIEGTKIHTAEVVQFLIDQMKLVITIGHQHFLLQLLRAPDSPAIQIHHLRHCYCILRLFKASEIAQQKPHCVADATIGIRHALEDLIRKTHFIGVVCSSHPQAQYIGAQGSYNLLRHNDIAQRLGHLATLVINGKSMRQYCFVWCAIMHGYRRKQ